MAEPIIEVCVEGVDGAIAAAAGGAHRIELCASLLEGGITPSLGTVEESLARVAVPLMVMVRPRGGDFLYSEAEFAGMLRDVAALRGLGVAGVVAGCLLPDGRIDAERMAAIVSAAAPLQVTCHRAFDMTLDLREALEALVACGVHRVLTSGGRDTALEAVAALRGLVDVAGNRIAVMACGGLDSGNIAAVRRQTGVPELHFAALQTVPSGMHHRNRHVGMGGTGREHEYRLTVTDADRVRRTIAAALA